MWENLPRRPPSLPKVLFWKAIPNYHNIGPFHSSWTKSKSNKKKYCLIALSFRASLKRYHSIFPLVKRQQKALSWYSLAQNACYTHHAFLFSRKGLFTQSIWLTILFFFWRKGRSRRTIEPLMCSDIIFGYSPITQPKASQTKDLHRGPSLGAAGSNATFQKGPIGKHRSLPC